MLLLIVGLSVVCLTLAASNGDRIGLCDVYGPFGCTISAYSRDHEGNLERRHCSEKSRIMNWAIRPTRNNTYRLWVDDEKAPTKQYTPGKLHSISIRVMKHQQNYRGFMMYVRDARNETVGKFELPKDDTPIISRYSPLCPDGTITHASAELKPVLLTHAWRAPAAGAGKLWVSALLKYGDANTGQFFWPNEEGDYELTEGPAATTPSIVWRQSPIGASCKTTCANKCLEQQTAQASPVSFATREFSSENVCKLPYLLTCALPLSSINDDQWCTFRDATCSALTTSACDATSTTNRLLCACDGGAPPAPPTTTPTSTVPPTTPTPTKSPVDGTTTKPSDGESGTTTPPPVGEVTTRVSKLYPTLTPRPGGFPVCEYGKTSCPCTDVGGCDEAEAQCVGRTVCDANTVGCIESYGVCVKRDCVAEENCPCNAGRCLTGLECVAMERQSICVPAEPPVVVSSLSMRLNAAAVLSTILGFSIDRRLALLAFTASAFAHNWVNSPSRATQASTVEPALQRRSATPHVQIAKGQTFQIEWALGHGDYSYFTILKAEDEQYLAGLTLSHLEKYISEAPTGATTIPEPRFRKYHRKNETTYDSLLDNAFLDDKNVVQRRATDTGFYKREVAPTDPLYRPRPSVFGEPLKQLEYTDANQSKDRRVAYMNPSMPYILAVHKYGHEALQAYRFDFANFEIPNAGDEPADYIVWYWWQSYRDITDVNYLGNRPNVRNVYGTLNSTTVWEKIDHCGYPDHKGLQITCSEAVNGDESECTNRCGGKYGCWGVVVAPFYLPNTVYEGWKDKHPIPWGTNTGKKDEWYPGAGYRFGYEGQNITCLKSSFPYVTENTMICAGVTPRDETETADGHQVVDDPLDPLWYSTCFVPKTIITFDTDPPPPTTQPMRWRFHRSCVSCELAHRNSYVALRSPRWAISDTCVDCSKSFDASLAAPPDLTPAKPNWTLIKKDTSCDGIRFDWPQKYTEGYTSPNSNTCNGKFVSKIGEPQCFKLVKPPGNQVAQQGSTSCAYAASIDAECSDLVLETIHYNGWCFCYRSAACCGTCIQRSDRFASLYRVPRLVPSTP